MGIDVDIAFEVTGDVERIHIPEMFGKIEPVGCFLKEANEGATHQIRSFFRYYGQHYERGQWPQICAVLMTLMASPDVGRVYYGGDSSEYLELMTPESINRISTFYMKHGTRPYHDENYKYDAADWAG